MIHEHNVEILYHFTCGRCKGWWSHAHTPDMNEEGDFETEPPTKLMYCPHCGEDGKVKIKKGFKGA